MKEIKIALEDLDQKIEEIDEEEQLILDQEKQDAEKLDQYPIEMKQKIQTERNSLLEQQKSIKKLLLEKKAVLIGHFQELKAMIDKIDSIENQDDEEEEEEEEEKQEEEGRNREIQQNQQKEQAEEEEEEKEDYDNKDKEEEIKKQYEKEKTQYIQRINSLIQEKNAMKQQIFDLSQTCKELENLYGNKMSIILEENKKLQSENEEMILKLENSMNQNKDQQYTDQQIKYLEEQKGNLINTLKNQDQQIDNLEKQNKMLEQSMDQIIEQAQYQQQLHDSILKEKAIEQKHLEENLNEMQNQTARNQQRDEFFRFIDQEIKEMEGLLRQKKPGVLQAVQ